MMDEHYLTLQFITEDKFFETQVTGIDENVFVFIKLFLSKILCWKSLLTDFCTF